MTMIMDAADLGGDDDVDDCHHGHDMSIVWVSSACYVQLPVGEGDILEARRRVGEGPEAKLCVGTVLSTLGMRRRDCDDNISQSCATEAVVDQWKSVLVGVFPHR